jgi:hypothetical protein
MKLKDALILVSLKDPRKCNRLYRHADLALVAKRNSYRMGDDSLKVDDEPGVVYRPINPDVLKSEK